jgi:uncharacterized protein (DUF4415 family)
MSSKRLKRPTDAENAAIEAGISADPDNPEWTAEDFAAARPAAGIVPQLARRRGTRKTPTKELISVRLGRDVLDRLRAGGRGWQSQVNATLRAALGIDVGRK